MRWITATHTMRYHAHYHTSGEGHLYQGRFKSFPLQDDDHFLTVCRYVERNALRAGLVKRAEDWRWGSLWRWLQPVEPAPAILSSWPIPRLPHWLDKVNQPLTEPELAAVRHCAQRGTPFGEPAWIDAAAQRLGLTSTLRPRGRPKGTPHADRREGRPDRIRRAAKMIDVTHSKTPALGRSVRPDLRPGVTWYVRRYLVHKRVLTPFFFTEGACDA